MERLGPSARQVVDLADEEARQLDHPYLGTEHLLLGLVTVEGRARDALLSAGATADATRAKVVESVLPRPPGQRGDPQLSQRARRAIDRASRLSLHRRDPQVEPVHLLIGVLDVEGRAGQVLRGLGVDVAALRVAVELPRDAVHRDGGPAGGAGAAGAATLARIGPRPYCPVCGASIEEPGLAYRIVAADDEHGDRRSFVVSSCGACGVVLGASPV